MLQKQFFDPFYGLRWCGLRMVFVDQWQIFQTFKTLCLKTAPLLIKACAIKPTAAAGFRNIPQFFGKFKNTQTLLSELR